MHSSNKKVHNVFSVCIIDTNEPTRVLGWTALRMKAVQAFFVYLQFSMTETTITGIYDQFQGFINKSKKRLYIFRLVVCLTFFVLGLPMTTKVRLKKEIISESITLFNRKYKSNKIWRGGWIKLFNAKIKKYNGHKNKKIFKAC